YLEDPRMEEAVANLTELLIAMNESGLIDLLKVISSSEVLESLLKYLMNPEILRLADRLDNYAELLERSGEIILSEEREKTGIGGLLKALKDPEVQIGLTKLIKLLKLLGSFSKK
ncbi:MAG: DUF1641 domain-containing protein, partial [Fervidicoccaceae archaeon]